MKKNAFTLLEMLIAIAISSFVMGIFYEVFITTSNTYRYHKALTKIQDNSRFLTKYFSDLIHQEGYADCIQLKSTHEHPLLEAYPSTNQYNDILSIHAFSGKIASLAESMEDKNHLVVTSSFKFKTNKPYLISDCKTTSLFQPVKISKKSKSLYQITSDQPILYLYHQYDTIQPYVYKTLFIKKTTRKNKQKNPVYSLYEKNNISRYAKEVLPGVERLKLMFGIFDKNHQLQFVSPNHVSNWNDVKFIQIDILLTSINNVLKKKQIYSFQRKNIKADDLRLYQSMRIRLKFY